MNPKLFAKMLRQYQDRLARAGRPVAEDQPIPSGISDKIEGNAITLRVQGPLDGGWLGVSAADIIKRLDAAGATEIMLLIDSPGGFVDEGMSLYTDLRQRAKDGANVRTESRGLVASAAIMPYLAGDTRTVPEGSLFMIHNSWSWLFAIGDYQDLQKESTAVLNGLVATTKLIRNIIADRTNTPVDEVKAQMDAETWFTADEAVEARYSNEVVEPQPDDDDDPNEVSDAIMKQYEASQERLVAAVVRRFGGV